MKFDVLLMTRTMKEDYTWFCCPDYVDHSINLLLRPLLIAAENQRNLEVFERDGAHNCFFLTERNYCVLVYLYFTDRCDSSGRKIYALEGLACEKKDSRIFWKLLPFLIQEIYGRTLENQYQIFSETAQRPYTRQLRMDVLDEYLIKDTEELLEEFHEYDDSFLNMLEETRKSGKLYSFLYGNRTQAFLPAFFERCYQWGEERKHYLSDGIAWVHSGEEELVRAFLTFEKKEQKYQAGAGLADPEGTVLLEWKDYLPVGKEGIDLWLLAGMETQIEELADFYGYRPVWRIWREAPVQLQLPLQWLEIPMPEHRITVRRFAARMELWRGCRASYPEGEEQLFFQLFQYACRIHKAFFARSEGRETLYLLTVASGLWIFSFLKESDGIWMRGIYVQAEEQERAWMFLDQLINRYILPDTDAYTGEFGEILSSFLAEAREMLLPGSFILSVLPEENFPHLPNLQIRTGPGTARAFQRILLHGTPETVPADFRDPGNSFENQNRGGERRLYPPRLGRRWKLTVPRAEHAGEVKISSISSAGNGSYWCDSEKFFLECVDNQ